MALFKRTKRQPVLPEVDKYYDGERRDRAGLAWLLALVSVIIVVFLILGIFWAGRWAFRSLTDNDDVAINDTSQTTPSFDGTPESEDGSRSNTNDDEGEQDSSETVLPGNEDEEPQGTVDAPARTDTPSTPPSVPITGDDPLPSTGPASMIGIFAGVSSIAGGLHYAANRKRHQ